MKDKQREIFDRLIAVDLPSAIKNKSTKVSDNLMLDFQLLTINIGNAVKDTDGTLYVPIVAKCNLHNDRKPEAIVFNVNLLKLPVYQELGFLIRGNYMQMLDSYDKTAGLHTLHKQTRSTNEDKAILQSDSFASVGFVREKNKLYTDLSLNGKYSDKIQVSPATFLRAITGMSKEELISKFGYENSYVTTIFDGSPSVFPECIAGFNIDSRKDCIQAVYAAMFGKNAAMDKNSGTIGQKLNEINRQLFNESRFNKGAYANQRIQHMQSFGYRCAGAVLTNTIDCNGIHVDAGTVLTSQMLRSIDATELDTLYISVDDKDFTIHKFARYWFGVLNYTLDEDIPECDLEKGTVIDLAAVDAINASGRTSINVIDLHNEKRTVTRDIDKMHLTTDDIFTIFDIWVNNLGGLQVYDNQFDLTNRAVATFDKRVIMHVEKHLDSVIQKIKGSFKINGSEEHLDNYIESFDKDINLDAFIDDIRSPKLKLGQMAETCNIMSFVSKDYKSTIANLKNIDDDLVAIQEHQYGRTDPFDIPESKKLASVQYRTLLAKTNDAGYITAPYLRVVNGEVVDEEPIYLTAIDETDRYIAEWNETFKNDDGTPKKYIKARYNGDIVSTELSNIAYKECSPYSGMSVSHACVVFPGHSDGKRITMGCNQLSQASPMAHTHRPYVNGGGESMVDYGFYHAYDVLQAFYNNSIMHRPYLEKYKDKILGSCIKLMSKHTEHGIMHLSYHIIAMDSLDKDLPTFEGQSGVAGIAFNETNMSTYVLDVPYSMQTNDNTMMSFNINPMPRNVYDPDDVICYSNSCSLEDKPHMNCMNVGAQKIDDNAFSKGLALVTPLRVGYKTWEGSTIDDAMVISDDCVFGDILTSIFTTRIVLDAKTFSETEYEVFGILDHKYPYFEENGLPRVGTYLNAGDPVIAKISHRKQQNHAKFKYLKMNQSGQVIYSGFTTKNGEEVAEVVLAQRAVVDVGDKFAGRCGNKGVVAKIVPAEQMPYDPETGFTLQVLLNPLGVPSRQNISQFLDVDLSECMRQEDKISYVSPYNDKDLEFVLDMKEVHNVKPKIFIDGRTGKPFERPIHWGTVSLYKLHHMVKKKYHAIGLSAPIDPVFMQPRRSTKLDGGQSFGEMESWCLMSVGANKVLQEIYGFQSTDINTRGTVRNDLEHGESIFSSSGTNSNDATMLACFRSLGVDFKTNSDEQVFEFPPLTDEAIHSFSVTPVDSAANLHNFVIFHGGTSKLEDKDRSRNSWGWIDLKMKLVHPNFICNSKILKMIFTAPCNLNKDIAEAIMQGYLSVKKVNSMVSCFELYKTSTCPPGLKGVAEVLEEPKIDVDEADAGVEFVTGMDAIVMMFTFMDTASVEATARNSCQSWLEKHGYTDASQIDSITDDGYISRVSFYHFAKEFNESRKLSDYVISSFPVMPQIYRPQFAGSKATEHVDFDWHYMQIMNAVTAVERNRTVDTLYKVYDRIKHFCGLSKSVTEADKKHKNIKTYFSGNNDNGDHGKIRSNVQSKRVFCSGRATIIPSHDTHMKPTEIGVPITMATKMYESMLIGLMSQKWVGDGEIKRSCIINALLLCSKRDRQRFIDYWDDNLSSNFLMGGTAAYDWVTKLIYDAVEGRTECGEQVVIAGRQPSLHKYAIRAYRPKIVLENVLNVHTLVCSGYNADFDGDQMWVEALFSEEAKEEAIRLFSPAVDIINPKDSSLILKHTQDVVLGLYCMTMLKDNEEVLDLNAGDIHHYSSVDQIITDLDAGILKTYDVACVNEGGFVYLSTAGRLYLNSIVNGFTNSDFTNPLGIKGIKPEFYKELKYDGIWRSGGNVKTGNFRYYKIADICMDIYNTGDSDLCMDVVQKLTELGFYYADKFGISLSLEDMMLKPVDGNKAPLDPDLMKLADTDLNTICSEKLTIANDLGSEIEQDCYDGLISEDDKDDALMALYYNGTGDAESEYNHGIHTQVMDTIMTKLRKTQRNNNIFILLDSGARGKADQIMRMCGFLPQLQKDKTSSLKAPVTHSYLNGLSSFDVHMTSYGIKQGLASTQNETPDAGYATRKGVYMTSGIRVVESDCGKTNWWYDVQYADIDEDRTTFMPSKEWFNENLLGKTLSPTDKTGMKILGLSEDSLGITSAAFGKLMVAGGFHSLQLTDSVISISSSSLVGQAIHLTDEVSFMKLRNTLNNRDMTEKSVKLAMKLHLADIITSSGTYSFKYKMDACSRSLMLYRQCKDLPDTRKVLDFDTGEYIQIVTEKTIDYIEDKNLRRVPVRILLDCKSEHGICAHCYGLKYSSLQLPKVGEYVGTEAAQALGEPSAQLTISLINQGGTAGAAINDGVKRFSDMLDGSTNNSAILAPRSGYVSIELLGEIATVGIKPADKNCSLCYNCAVDGECPLGFNDDGIPACYLKDTINASLLICNDGDWVEASQALTVNIPSPTDVAAVTVEKDNRVFDTTDFDEVYRRKQIMWLSNYFETFHSKDIDINARHFELFTRVQNLQGLVYSSNDPDFKVGETYEIPSMLGNSEVKFRPVLSKRADVITNTSGAMAALSFERVQSVAANLCVKNFKSSYKFNNSLLSDVAVGTDLASGEPKKLGATRKTVKERKKPKLIEIPQVTYKEVESVKIDDTDDVFENFDFSSVFGDTPLASDTVEPAKMDIDTEKQVVQEPIFDSSNNAAPNRMTFDDESDDALFDDSLSSISGSDDEESGIGDLDSETYAVESEESVDELQDLDDYDIDDLDDLDDDDMDDLDDVQEDKGIEHSSTSGPSRMEF